MSQETNQNHPTEEEPTPHAAPIIPKDLAPTIYLDALQGFALDDFVVKTNAVEVVFVQSLPEGTVMHQRTAAHLVMPTMALFQIYAFFLGRKLQ